jgi:hypothetical protein
MHSFDHGTQLLKKLGNWDYLERFFKKYNIPLTQADWDPVIYNAPDAAVRLITKVYKILQNKEIQPSTTSRSQPAQPYYARPTAAQIMKDSQLRRIPDETTQRLQARIILAQHNQYKRLELTQPGRLKLPQETIVPEKSRSPVKKKQVVEELPVVQVEVKSNDKNLAHLRTAKNLSNMHRQDNSSKSLDALKQPSAQDLFMKPVGEFFSELVVETLSLPSFKTVAQMDFRDVEQGDDLTKTFFSKVSKLSPGMVSHVFALLRQRANYMGDIAIKQAKEFNFFSELIFEALDKLVPNSDPFIHLLDSLAHVIERLISKDLILAEGLLIEHMLERLVILAGSASSKREVVCHILHLFTSQDPLMRARVVQSLADFLPKRCELVKFLAALVKYDKEFVPELHVPYIEAAKAQLYNPSPVVRTSAIAVLSHLAQVSPEHVYDCTEDMTGLVTDSWWEVRAQLLQCAGILLTKAGSGSALLGLVLELFKVTSNKNVVRIGLIYLATALCQPELSKRYVECLLAVSSELRRAVLSTQEVTETTAEGLYVLGTNTQKYKLGGVPLIWDALVVAESLARQVQDDQLDNLDVAHIEVLTACLLNEPTEAWLGVYESLKDYLFVALCDVDICSMSAHILIRFMTAPGVMLQVLASSAEVCTKALSLLFSATHEAECITNAIRFLKSLYWETNLQPLKDFVFIGLKNFSNKYAEVFEHSDLVEVMNEIISHRRGDIFPEDRLDSPATGTVASSRTRLVA